MSAEPQTALPESKAGTVPPTEGAGSALLLQQDGDPSSAAPLFASGQNPTLAALPLQLDVSVPIPTFRVRDLLSLAKGSVLESNWSYAEDVPVWCGGVQLLWTEFEVVDHVLAVRVTRVG